MFETTDVSIIVDKHLDWAKSVQNMMVLALLQFNKFISVLLKIYNETDANGSCPVKELDEDVSKTSDDFKTFSGEVEGNEDEEDKEQVLDEKADQEIRKEEEKEHAVHLFTYNTFTSI